uniref:Uncharacterized protein n=1 Tax=Lepeophtheirus salmonis TaxID=72036 RepID=A0A0K2TKW7_LEPSM
MLEYSEKFIKNLGQKVVFYLFQEKVTSAHTDINILNG